MNYALKSNFLFWLGMHTAEATMTRTLLATDDHIVAAASPAERARVRGILRDILPISARAEGLRNDARLAGAPQPIALERIAAPTLVISLEDDRFDTFVAAQYLVAKIPGARLRSYPTGGHVWVGHDAEMFEEIVAFLKEGGRAP